MKVGKFELNPRGRPTVSGRGPIFYSDLSEADGMVVKAFSGKISYLIGLDDPRSKIVSIFGRSTLKIPGWLKISPTPLKRGYNTRILLF